MERLILLVALLPLAAGFALLPRCPSGATRARPAAMDETIVRPGGPVSISCYPPHSTPHLLLQQQLLLQPEPHRPSCARVCAQLEKALQRGGLEEEGGQNHWLSEVGWAKFMDEEAKSSCKPPRVEPGSLQCSALPTHSLHARSRR